MENIPVFNNRLDESNGTVENVLEMKAKKTPWFLRFAQKAKGIVSFVQNLLSPLTRKEGVRGGQVSAFFQSVAAAAVGIGLLVGSTVDVQAACDPPVYDVCFHKIEGDWSTAGLAKMIVEFDGVPGKTYRYRFSGWMYRFNYSDGTDWYGYGQVTGRFSSSASLECADFWWDPDRGGTGGYLQIYEEGTSRSWRRGGPKVLGKWIASVDFYPYQEASLVYLNNSAIPFEFSQYYCTIDWDPIPVPLKYGYTLGCWEWVGNRPVWPKYNGWLYHGDHGSPRFDYRSSCSYEFDPSPSFGNRCP